MWTKSRDVSINLSNCCFQLLTPKSLSANIIHLESSIEWGWSQGFQKTSPLFCCTAFEGREPLIFKTIWFRIVQKRRFSKYSSGYPLSSNLSPINVPIPPEIRKISTKALSSIDCRPFFGKTSWRNMSLSRHGWILCGTYNSY